MIQSTLTRSRAAAIAPPADLHHALRLDVHLADGRRFHPAAMPGATLGEMLVAYGLPIKEQAGGAGPDASCHIRVPAVWRPLLPPVSREEQALLEALPGVGAGSRLAGFIVMTEELDGLELEIQADCLLPQTNWVAG